MILNDERVLKLGKEWDSMFHFWVHRDGVKKGRALAPPFSTPIKRQGRSTGVSSLQWRGLFLLD